MKPFKLFMLLLAGLILPAGAPAAAENDPTKKRIVLIAGVKSHGPEGNRIHDYPWSVRLLKTMLENSNIREQAEVTTVFNGWPADPSVLETADTIMIVSDGRDGDRYSEAPHLDGGERVRTMDRLLKKGCGIVVFHFSTFAPDRLADEVLEWHGGYFDWETGGRREWYSNIETLEAEVSLGDSNHPVLNGVSPFVMREEFYYDIRFRDNDPRWTPIWKVDDLSPAKPKGGVVSWAVQREGGGRGFATTCGHFYDNWKLEDFRKTLLNALAWTAHIPVPEQGVESEFFDRESIARHLEQPGLLPAKVETADETEYADKPYWYKPGHPWNPADSSDIQTLPDFKAERIFAVPRELGSWTALTVDPERRLIAAAQHQPGLYAVTVPPANDPDGETKVERLKGAAENMGWTQGLLYAFDSLYVTVAERNDFASTGVHRLRDIDGDGEYDESELILKLESAGEHGPHNLVAGPGGKDLYLMAGNGTPAPDGVRATRPVQTEGLDHLMPNGFESSTHTLAGWVMRFDPDGSNRELMGAGLRNSYDLAFNRRGDLFTWDSDMEWDLGAPWYRPTRVCHLVSGAEFGWRGDAAKWPEYYEDSVPPVVNIGPGSPTGVVFGYGTNFPAKYQNAFYVCDWTFATIHAVHMKPKGASYEAEVEEFLGGNGLPLTDVIVGKDGSLYFVVGGRKLGSALYRVRYTGDDGAAPVNAMEPVSDENQRLAGLRRELEAYHGRMGAGAIEAAWPHLDHEDRFIRFAARVAVESQPVDQWRERVLKPKRSDRPIDGLLALARQGSEEDLREVLESAVRRDWSALTEKEKLRMLRVCEMALARGEGAVRGKFAMLKERLRPAFPDDDWRVNRELARLLCYMGDPSAIKPALDLMQADEGKGSVLGASYFARNQKYGVAVRDMLESKPLVQRMHYAQMLLWLDDGWTESQRRRYFELIADAKANSKGGHQYLEFWNRIREIALNQIPENQREEYESIGADIVAPWLTEEIDPPKGPGRNWTLEESMEALGAGLRGRDFETGRKMYVAAGCATCHPFHGVGGAIGPDLSAIGQRFTVRDILDSIIHPSDAISDQYQMTVLETSDGQTVTGRIVSRDGEQTRIATDLMRPTQSIAVANDRIVRRTTAPVSTMPSGLLNPLNEDELLDLLAYLVSGGNPEAEVFEVRAKPNLLFLFADDMCYETISEFGHTDIDTPNLDRLARTGTVFSRAYNMGAWHGAVCVASRTMINTGRFVWRARALEKELNQEVETGRFWAQQLSRAGYETYFSGKWHVKADPRVIFDNVVHVRPGMPKDTEAGYQRPAPGSPDPWSPSDPKFGGFWEGGKHWSEVLADDAEGFFQMAEQSEKPFFMYLAFNAPHDPRQSPQEYLDRYPLNRIQLPENFLPRYPYMEDIGAGKGLRDERLAAWPRTPYAVQVHRREYYALITHMDAQIGRILDALEASGKAENTYILFTADHGLAVGRHGLFGKQNMYEHSLRPPLIVKGPGVPEGKTIDARVYLQDIMPTTLELAGADVPDYVEFKSLTPLIRGERAVQYESIYGAYREDQQRAIIHDDFKLIHYPGIHVYRLYHLKDDPMEQRDLAGDESYAELLSGLKKRLNNLQIEMDDPLTAPGMKGFSDRL